MEYQLKSVALHITNECSGKCPFCYYTSENQIKCEGNIDVLKKSCYRIEKRGGRRDQSGWRRSSRIL